MPISRSQYQIQAEVRRSPVSACFRATRSSDGRQVTLYDYGPFPTQTALPGASLAERLERKLRAAATLNHPALPRIVDSGVEGDHFLVALEWIEGRTLESLLSEQERIPFPRAREILSAVIAAIRELEGCGWCHGDLHPGAIVVDSDGGAVRLTDIGIPTAFRELEPEFGSAPTAYQSPERRAGLNVDSRSDQYSVGVLLYRMLTGNLPPEPPAELDLPDLPPETAQKLSAVIQRACRADPNGRYGGVTALAAAISLTGQGDRGSQPSAPTAFPGIGAPSGQPGRESSRPGAIRLILCPACRQSVSNQAVGCPNCGHPIKPAAPIPLAPPEAPDLTHLNWGGCLLSLPWAIANHVWEGLFAVLGLGSKTLGWMVQVGVGLYLLGNGNRLAWNGSRKWESVDQFYRVQHRWAVAGFIVAIGTLVIVWVIYAGLAASQGNRLLLNDGPGGLDEWLRGITNSSNR